MHNAYPGLFPPAGPQVWDPQLPWQPIPVHTVPLDQEYLLNKMHAFCPRWEVFKSFHFSYFHDTCIVVDTENYWMTLKIEMKCRSCTKITNSSLNMYQTTLERHFMIFGGMWCSNIFDFRNFVNFISVWVKFGIPCFVRRGWICLCQAGHTLCFLKLVSR